jgi:hypothetical protein
MKPKNKNTIILLTILIVSIISGVGFTSGYQKNELNTKNKKLTELRKMYGNTDKQTSELSDVEKEAARIDSLLELNPVNIPKNIPEEKFYDFVNQYSSEYFIYAGVSTEFIGLKTDGKLNYYEYKVYGNGRYTDVFNLIKAIEYSKELKKIESAEIKANTIVSPEGIPKYLVAFTLKVKVYFTDNEKYASSKITENKIEFHPVYNAYYPLIRNEILPNIMKLPDVQNGLLVSLVPQGAFIKINDGNTMLMKKGDQVYLGYLTEIDYSMGNVTFSLNKGGIVEDLVLELGVKKTGRKQ